jgi:hypothetical protein
MEGVSSDLLFVPPWLASSRYYTAIPPHQGSRSTLNGRLMTLQILSPSKRTSMRGTTACSFEPLSCNGVSLDYQPEKAWFRYPRISTRTSDMRLLDQLPSNSPQSGSKTALRRWHSLHSSAPEPMERSTPPSLRGDHWDGETQFKASDKKVRVVPCHT